MTLKAVPAFAMITIIGLGVEVEARTPCQEYLRLRNAATEAWKQAMRAPPSERCGALYHASLAAEATLKYADNNRESCDISVQLLNQVEGYHREAVQAREHCKGHVAHVALSTLHHFHVDTKRVGNCPGRTASFSSRQLISTWNAETVAAPYAAMTS
jgi:hypothetical protein